MGRPPDGREARSELVRTRVTPTMKRQITSARGTTPESTYLRRLIEADARAKGL